MALLSRVSLDKAVGFGFQVWKCILDNWGNLGTGSTADGLRYLLNRSIGGVAIAPESDVGEVALYVNLENDIASQDLDSFQSEDTVYVRRGHVYSARTPGPITLHPTFPTLWGDVLYVAGGATPAATGSFGGALAATEFYSPKLVLNVFLDAVPQFGGAPSAPLEPKTIRILALDDTNEHLLRFVPVQYRNRMRLCVENLSAADALSVRVTGIRGGYSRMGFPPITSYLREFDLAQSPIAVAANTRVSTVINDPEILWLGIYATKAANTAASNVGVYLYAD